MVDFKSYVRTREETARRRCKSSRCACLRRWLVEKVLLRKRGLTLRKVFQDGDLMQKIDGALGKAGYETELTPDEEHGLWEIETMTRSGINIGHRLEFR